MLAATISFDVELVTFAFVQTGKAGTFHRADMHESIGLPVVADEEAETLHRIEELHGTRRAFAGQLALRRTAAAASAAATGRSLDDVANDLKILRGRLAATINEIELEFLPFSKPFEASTLDSGDMDEDVLATTILLDEAKTLLGVEELDGSLAGSDDLCRHAIAAATAAAAETTAATAAAEATAAATAITAAKTIATAEAIAAPVVSVIARRGKALASTEGIETLFTDIVALVPTPTTSFVVTHNKIRTLSRRS